MSTTRTGERKQHWKRKEARIFCEICKSWYFNNVHQKNKHLATNRHKKAVEAQIQSSKRASTMAGKHVNYSYLENATTFELPDLETTLSLENKANSDSKTQETDIDNIISTPKESIPPVIEKTNSVIENETPKPKAKAKNLQSNMDLFGNYQRFRNLSDSSDDDDDDNVELSTGGKLSIVEDVNSSSSDSDDDTGWTT